MRLSELYKSPPSTAPIFMRAGKETMSKIYGKQAKLKGTVSGRYTKQPVFELKPPKK